MEPVNTDDSVPKSPVPPPPPPPGEQIAVDTEFRNTALNSEEKFLKSCKFYSGYS